MSKPTPIESVTVELEGGRTVTMPRSELERTDGIRAALEQFDRVRVEIHEADYERQKLAHAHLSMQAQLNRLCKQYAQETYGELPGAKEEDSTDGQ